MHGTAMASTMHMPIGNIIISSILKCILIINKGSKYCCGVLEIFPDGDFKYIRGYGNLARRMGHHYSRLELSSNYSMTKTNNLPGSYVPPNELISKLDEMIAMIHKKSSCILPSIIKKKY